MNRKFLKYVALVLIVGIWSWFMITVGGIVSSVNTALDGPTVYELDNLVTVSRSPDWKYGKGFYTAVIVMIPKGDSTFDVECRVHVGDANYFENIVLGQVASLAEAMDKWGDIEWRADSLVIGKEAPYQKIISRQRIETHR